MGSKRVSGERDNGDARGALAKPRQWQQKSKHGQRRNGLQHIGDADHRLGPAGRTREPDAGGYGDGGRKQHGRTGEPKVLDRERGDFAAVLRKKCGAHAGSVIRCDRASVVGRGGRRGHRRRSPACVDRRNSSRARFGDHPAFAQAARCDRRDRAPHPDRASPAARSCCSRSRRSRSMSCISARVSGSSAPNGSSIRRICGSRSERTRQADALPLPAGKLMGIAMRKRCGIEADQLQQLVAAIDSLLARLPFSFKNDADVALHVEMRKQAGLLDHIAHPSAQIDRRQLLDRSCPRPGPRRRSAQSCDLRCAEAWSFPSRCGRESPSRCLPRARARRPPAAVGPVAIDTETSRNSSAALIAMTCWAAYHDGRRDDGLRCTRRSRMLRKLARIL